MSSENRYDIFISYAHVDNASQSKVIDNFVIELEAIVNQQVGLSSTERIWKDNRWWVKSVIRHECLVQIRLY